MSAGVCDSAGRLSAWVHAAPAWQSIPLLGTAAARSHGRSSGRPGSRGGVRLSSVTVCVGFGHPCTGRMRMDAYACNSFLCLCVCVYLSLPPLHSHHYPLLPPPSFHRPSDDFQTRDDGCTRRSRARDANGIRPSDAIRHGQAGATSTTVATVILLFVAFTSSSSTSLDFFLLCS